MLKPVTAIYENGVFRPLKKVKLREHQQVELDIHTKEEKDNAIKNALSIIRYREKFIQGYRFKT